MEDWRRIDIDAFDPESGRLTAADLIPPNQAQVTLQELQPKIQQIRSMSTSGDMISAIQLATSDPPYGADDSTKAQYLQAVLEALGQTRQADISNIIKQLSPKQHDVLIKYLYKGMSVPEGQKQGGILLSWFEKLTQEAGVNPVVHYLSDRRTV
ncbi:hypothetical protein Kpol_411p15 [Vanderwaltozyma polyspora DSM 70294]|uniref:Actin-related protein 2/3 complex subunit 5 n=1 Tax=Vanderwaltozyma polyspora (strain ATCC 22028 / DSM 70294 / BCRC 21397 / CBS 2163 / NBRC 10782 / NRRL Y-8283 / UCD 57-17) TaxID=436907 RepID=A7TRP8_VANPO|nr:uncharacterized protein Kpol_411p15 [Vanderwaltozyma polyspora DSM 70294]EDO15070.1 hypothetical protein Kpol_411p15 [Vanderwaltozyma polyspora DSM 70294]